jgi:hypothetical protein
MMSIDLERIGKSLAAFVKQNNDKCLIKMGNGRHSRQRLFIGQGLITVLLEIEKRLPKTGRSLIRPC